MASHYRTTTINYFISTMNSQIEFAFQTQSKANSRIIYYEILVDFPISRAFFSVGQQKRWQKCACIARARVHYKSLCKSKAHESAWGQDSTEPLDSITLNRLDFDSKAKPFPYSLLNNFYVMRCPRSLPRQELYSHVIPTSYPVLQIQNSVGEFFSVSDRKKNKELAWMVKVKKIKYTLELFY